jgi:hypothetical protein
MTTKNKILTVATEVQAVVLTEILLGEIATGFWKNARPADHADYWKGVVVQVGSDLGPNGFEVPRNYNFVNPDFFQKAETNLMNVAKTVNPDITIKQLKKQLISLNQILGSRLKEIGGSVMKLPRGRKTPVDPVITTTTEKKTKASVRKAAATFVEPITEEATTA